MRESRITAAIVGLGVVALAAVVAAVIAFFTLHQSQPQSITDWSNSKLTKELGEPQTTFDCGALDQSLKGLSGALYVDQANKRVTFLCVAPS